MNLFFWLLLILNTTPGPVQVASPSSLAATIRAQKWQKRVLLLCAPTATNPDLRRQQQLLRPLAQEITSRDLLVREVLVQELGAADRRYVREQLGVTSAGFTLVLIGKDGGVKRRATRPLPPAELFATIDVMPMRRQEMRQSD